jgi:hypothetical protein
MFIFGLIFFSLIENRLIKRKKAFESSFLALSLNFVLLKTQFYEKSDEKMKNYENCLTSHKNV